MVDFTNFRIDLQKEVTLRRFVGAGTREIRSGWVWEGRRREGEEGRIEGRREEERKDCRRKGWAEGKKGRGGRKEGRRKGGREQEGRRSRAGGLTEFTFLTYAQVRLRKYGKGPTTTKPWP
jgi:hypothetical protein